MSEERRFGVMFYLASQSLKKEMDNNNLQKDMAVI